MNFPLHSQLLWTLDANHFFDDYLQITVPFKVVLDVLQATIMYIGYIYDNRMCKNGLLIYL